MMGLAIMVCHAVSEINLLQHVSDYFQRLQCSHLNMLRWLNLAMGNLGCGVLFLGLFPEYHCIYIQGWHMYLQLWVTGVLGTAQSTLLWQSALLNENFQPVFVPALENSSYMYLKLILGNPRDDKVIGKKCTCYLKWKLWKCNTGTVCMLIHIVCILMQYAALYTNVVEVDCDSCWLS